MKTLQAPSKNPSKKHFLLENLLRTLLRVACCCMTPLVAQMLHHLCRATAVALHWCRIFRLMFSQCRTRIALHPLKCLKEDPVAPFWGGVAHKVGHAYIINRVALQGVSQLQCRESRYTETLRWPPWCAPYPLEGPFFPKDVSGCYLIFRFHQRMPCKLRHKRLVVKSQCSLIPHTGQLLACGVALIDSVRLRAHVPPGRCSGNFVGFICTL